MSTSVVSSIEKDVAEDFYTGVTDVRSSYYLNSNQYFFLENGSEISFCTPDDKHRYSTVGGFVGGVLGALALEGRISPENANPDFVADVCFHLGQLVSGGKSRG